ncbi:hypothetical protein [Nonomuraea longicatena]|uniref:Uncharacterized protein n=1 Tax=Nonomuraea longicatena TaxID=83682 RepID=A0ABN1PNY1_9ACTN
MAIRETPTWSDAATGTPEKVIVATSTAHVVRAVGGAMAARRRIAVRSGGTASKSSSTTRPLIDMVLMDRVEYDP